jgi:hypothetical protein
MGLLDAIISDVVDSRGNKKKEWAYNARYLAGHPEFIGNRTVVIWVNEDELAIHKKALVYGKGDLLFKIPYSKVVSVEGDGSTYTNDNTFTARRLTVTVSGEDAKGKKCDVPIAFDIGMPWKSIPKIIGLINKGQGVKI